MKLKWIKNELLFIGGVVIAMLPILLYLNIILDINLIKDYGFWTLCGFWFCVFWYTDIMKKILKRRSIK